MMMYVYQYLIILFIEHFILIFISKQCNEGVCLQQKKKYFSVRDILSFINEKLHIELLSNTNGLFLCLELCACVLYCVCLCVFFQVGLCVAVHSEI